MVSMRVGLAAGLLLLLAACRGPLAVGTALHERESAPAWVNDPDLAARTTRAAAVMARVWGGDPSALDGWTVTFVDRFIERNGRSIVVGNSRRRPIVGGGKIDIWTGTSRVCVEATNLAHEVGHVVIHDGGHRDPRWRDPGFWDRMAEALREEVPPDDPACRAQLASGKGIWH